MRECYCGFGRDTREQGYKLWCLWQDMSIFKWHIFRDGGSGFFCSRTIAGSNFLLRCLCPISCLGCHLTLSNPASQEAIRSFSVRSCLLLLSHMDR